MSQTGFIALADVVAALNATYDSVNLVYSVYGLNVSVASFQAHVTFANNYAADILGAVVGQTDPRYQTAWFVALDIACIRILVTSMGGSLQGAFDYFLGDMRIARAGAYAKAITDSLQGYKDDLSRHLVNITPIAVRFEQTAAGEVPFYKGGLASP